MRRSNATRKSRRSIRVPSTPDYFKAMGIPLIEGRFFDARDTATAPPVGDHRRAHRQDDVAGRERRSASASACRRS